MHLRFVEIFCDVAQRRSFSKGAQAHHVSQSSASQAVLFLEQRLGTTLIDRSKRPLELTPAGRVYYDGCREMLDRFRAIEDQVRTFHDRVAGALRVAAIYSVGLTQMEQFLERFGAEYPEVELRLEYLHPDDVYRQVLEDQADLGLVSFPRHGGEFVSLDWQKQPMVLVASPGHRLARQSAMALGDLQGEDYVGFTQELTIRREVDRWLRRGRVGVGVVHEFDNIETIKRAIEIGSGVALLPLPTVRKEVESGALVAIEISDVELFRPLGIVHKRGRRLTTAAQKFAELLRKDAGAQAASAEHIARRAPRRRNTGGAKAMSALGADRNGSRRKKSSRA